MKYIIPAIILALGLYYWLTPKEIFVSHQCEIGQGSCSIDKSGLKAEVVMMPIPLNPNKDFNFQIKFLNNSISKVEALLIGLSFNHAPVQLPLKKKTPGLFKAKTLFPICTEQKMKWRIHLVTVADGKKYKVNFDFEVSRD